mmetsp:Transcript_63349/g.182288  ORF Transcript_63349/g.182288 Transcript_63349/m.182288 type:complete len:242 (-) Transcript_63349:385-1110(-)
MCDAEVMEPSHRIKQPQGERPEPSLSLPPLPGRIERPSEEVAARGVRGDHIQFFCIGEHAVELVDIRKVRIIQALQNSQVQPGLFGRVLMVSLEVLGRRSHPLQWHPLHGDFPLGLVARLSLCICGGIRPTAAVDLRIAVGTAPPQPLPSHEVDGTEVPGRLLQLADTHERADLQWLYGRGDLFDARCQARGRDLLPRLSRMLCRTRCVNATTAGPSADVRRRRRAPRRSPRFRRRGASGC